MLRKETQVAKDRLFISDDDGHVYRARRAREGGAVTTPMTIPHTAEELASLRADVARWRSLAQEWRRELDTVYERIDEHLPRGPDWGNVLARIQAAGNEIDRLRATIDLHDPPSPPLDLVQLTVAHRCECCGRMMQPDTIAAHFYDDDSGDVYAHAGPCVASTTQEGAHV